MRFLPVIPAGAHTTPRMCEMKPNMNQTTADESLSKSLADRVALVTGSSRGLGAAVAARLASSGARVAVHYKGNRDKARGVADEIARAGGIARLFAGDVAEPASVRSLVREVVEGFGRIDILVNNAGIFGLRPFGEIDPDFVLYQFSTHVLSTIMMMQEAVPHFPKSGGSIVNFSSSLVRSAYPGASVYSAAKAAVENLTQSFARELGPRGIRVNAVAPGTTDTDMTSGITPAERQAIAERTPLRRFAEPDDIAGLVTFLVSPDARWVTGRTVVVDGGYTAF